MPDTPTIDITLQSSSPVINMSIDKGVEPVTQIKLVSVSKDVTTGTSPNTVIAVPGQTKQTSFTSNVPSGYTCIGYNSIQVTKITGGAADGIVGNSAAVTFMNVGDIDMKPYGHRIQGSTTYYYYTVKATLICVRNGVLE